MVLRDLKWRVLSIWPGDENRTGSQDVQTPRIPLREKALLPPSLAPPFLWSAQPGVGLVPNFWKSDHCLTLLIYRQLQSLRQFASPDLSSKRSATSLSA